MQRPVGRTRITNQRTTTSAVVLSFGPGERLVAAATGRRICIGLPLGGELGAETEGLGGRSRGGAEHGAFEFGAL